MPGDFDFFAKEDLPVETSLTAVSETLSQILEGVPPMVKRSVEQGILLYGEDLSEITDKNELGRKEEDKIGKIRYAYNVLSEWLISNKINDLNKAQRLFINTGALCDTVYFKETGKTVQLLEPKIYAGLLNTMDDMENLPKWANQIYRVQDKFKIIATLELPPIGLDAKGRKLYMDKQHKKEVKADVIRIKELNDKKNSTLKETEDIISQIESHIAQYYEYVRNIPNLQNDLKNIKKYKELLELNKLSEQEQKELNSLVENNVMQAGQNIANYTDGLMEVMRKIKPYTLSVDKKNQELREVTGNLSKIETGTFDKKQNILIDDESLKQIKNDISFSCSYSLGGARSSALRVAESTSRVLLDAHTANMENPLQQCYCTVQNVKNALEKIFKIHTNMFPLDMNGEPIIPAIMIEPIRNYSDWFDDRFVINFVSGDPGRKGPRYSFSPVDFAVLRACGQYLCKDRIFDYRGDRLNGTFMSDYAGKIESKTAVKWAGEEKKMTLVATSKEVDAASRDDAVKDYMDFIFNMANDFPPPVNLSKRKIAIMLRYIIVESVEKTIALLLKIVVDRELEEAKNVLMYYAEGDKYKANELIKGAAAVDPVVAAEGVTSYLRKLFAR